MATNEEKKAAQDLSDFLSGRFIYKQDNILEIRSKRDLLLLIKDIKDNKYNEVKLLGTGKAFKQDNNDVIFRYRLDLDNIGKFTILANISKSPVEVSVISKDYTEQTMDKSDVEDLFEDNLRPYANKVKYALQRVFFREQGLDKKNLQFVLSVECQDGVLLIRISVMFDKNEDIVPDGMDSDDEESINALFEKELTDVAKRTFGVKKFMNKEIDKFEFSFTEGIKSLKVLLKGSREDSERYKTWDGVVYDIEFN